MPNFAKRISHFSLSSLIFGNPLKSQNSEENKVGVLASIPIFGSSIISSEGYSVDEMLYVLVALGAVGFAHMAKVSLGVILLLISIMLVYKGYPEQFILRLQILNYLLNELLKLINGDNQLTYPNIELRV